MNIILFYHSVVSDWNHGNAHFLRGVMQVLLNNGHEVVVYEPAAGWSLQHLKEDYGLKPVKAFHARFPHHRSVFYDPAHFDAAKELKEAGLVIVHEWNDPLVVKAIGKYRSVNDHFVLLFHDTHHRAVSLPEEMGRYDLKHYDGVLAFGEVLRQIYLRNGWAKKVWTWHEAADTHIFHPMKKKKKKGDLVWIGNWGDEERTEELEEYIIRPVKELGLKADFYGVRYPAKAIKMLSDARIGYKGWLPNYLVPEVFSSYRVTVQVPRRPYVENLPGIPTIRPFEAMASGIPLICSPWNDAEHLFTAGKDYLTAASCQEMKDQLIRVLQDREVEQMLVSHALQTILERHTCEHRVSQLWQIYRQVTCDNEIESSVLTSNKTS